MKNKKNYMGFLFHKHNKFWSISLGFYIDQNPFISEECLTDLAKFYLIVHFWSIIHMILAGRIVEETNGNNSTSKYLHLQI